MKRHLFGWISAMLGICAGLALLEGTAVVWLLLEDGRYSPASTLFERTQNTYVRDLTRGSTCRYVDTLFPHPYVGFVHHANPPCGLPNINNVGLFGEDFPGLKRADRFTVLLTGGSVAGQLGQTDPPPAPRWLEEELNARYLSPNGAPFVVLNGGDGAWKQPQQFILFALYASSVDAVVTLDGYNEHYFFRPWRITERLERPLSNFVDVNPFVADENFGDAAVGWMVGRIAATLAQAPLLGHSHAAYMVVRAIESVAKGKDRFGSTKRTTLNGIFALPAETVGDPARVFAYQMDAYRKFVRGMAAIAGDQQVETAFFLQPTPAIDKVLTPQERAVVGDLAYGDTYRKMIAGMMVLRSRGIAIFDLGDVFAGEAGTIYADDIHVVGRGQSDSRGNRLLAARMALHMAETWGLKARPQP